MALRACLLVLLVSAAAATPAQAAGVFFDRFDFAGVLAQNGERPFPAVGADGTLYLAYRDGSGNTPPGRVAIRTRSPAGTFSPDQQLVQPDATPTANQFPFGLGLAADGTATVLWRENTGLDILVRRFSRTGVLDPTTTQVNATGQGVGQDSDLAVRPSGAALVTWRNGTTDRIVLREVSPAGVPGPERPVSDPGDDPEGGPQVAVAPDGAAFVVWRSGNAPPGRILLRSISPSGVLGPKLTIASGGNPGGAEVSVDAPGRVYVSWFDGRVRLRVRRADGSLGPTEDVSPAGAGGSAAAVSTNGDAAFTWQQAGATTIAGRRRSAAGGYGPVVTLAAAQTGSQFQGPHLSIEAGGEAVAIWERLTGTSDTVEGRGFRRNSALDAVVTLSEDSSSILGNSAIANDGLGRTMVVSQNGTTDKFRVQTGDFGGPEQRGLTAPPVVERGVPAAFSFTPFDAQSGIGPSRWVFSDDGATVASATATHSFARAGSFTARSIGTDSVGNAREFAHAVRVADTRKPAIARVSLQRARFRLGAKPVARTAKRRAKRSTRLRYTLSEDARVSIAVQRRTLGRRVGRSCRKATRSNRRRRRCVRFVRVKLPALSRTQLAGRRSVVFTGRVGRRRLTAGRYRFALQARDPSGNLSAKRTKSFRIVR